MIAAPFHAGERTLQALAGSREQMEVAGPRVIRDYMPQCAERRRQGQGGPNGR